MVPEKIELYDNTVFGAGYVSNEWDAATGKGIITFDGPVTTIGVDAFYGCTSLTEIIIPDSVTTIGDLAFYGCTSLTEIIIPDGVTAIGSNAFSHCSSLTEITIGNSVTEIGDWAFANCTSLAAIYCRPTTPPTGNYDMFAFIPSDAVIYVPVGSGEAYKTAEYWSNYAGMIAETAF